ncbi:MAG: TonB family protein [Gemmatimonadota bacterium]
MIGYAMLYAVVVSFPVALAAVAAARALRSGKRPERFVWLAGIALLGFVPLIGLTRHAPEPEQAIGPGPLPDVVAVSDFAPIDRGIAGLPALLEVPPPPTLAVAESSIGIDAILLGLWLALTAVLALRWSVAAFRLRRTLASATRDELGGIAVWRTADVGPGVAGVFRPRIVVPEWLASLPESQQRLVVRHEHEHVRAADPLLVAVGRMARVLMPWNPVAWVLSFGLHRGVELDCDRRVLRVHPDVETYGSTLIAVSSLHSGAFAGAAAFADSEASLRQRILAMTARPGATSIVSVIGAVILGVIVMVGVFQVPVPTLQLSLGADPLTPVAATADAQSDGEAARLAAELDALRGEVEALRERQVISNERVEEAERAREALLDRLRAAEDAMAAAPTGDTPLDGSVLGSISGLIEDEVSGLPLEHIQVFIRGTGVGTLTNGQGQFALEALPAGDHEVVALRMGYRETSQRVAVEGGTMTNADFRIREVAIDIDGVLHTEDPVRRDSWTHPGVYIDGRPVRDHEYALDVLTELHAEGQIAEIQVVQGDATREILGRHVEAGAILVTKKVAGSVSPGPHAYVRPIFSPSDGRPRFTPFVVAPRLVNPEEVQVALAEAFSSDVQDSGPGGTVELYLFINEEGMVEDTRISQSSGVQAFDNAALATAAVQRFSPALNRDQPVPVWVSMPMTLLSGM